MPFGPILRAMTHNRTRALLIILEVACTLAIVTNCVNMIVDERAKMHIQSGFDDDNLVWVNSSPFAPEFKGRQYRVNQVETDMRVIRGIPGVRAVCNTFFIPWQGGGSSGTVKIAGSKDVPVRSQIYYGSGDMFGTLGTHVIEGRDFVPNDYDYDQENGSPKVILVSKGLAELVFKTPHVIGKQIDDGQGTHTIVGVFDPFYNPYPWPIHNYAFFGPATIASQTYGSQYLVRVQPGAMKSVMAAIDTELPKANRGRVITLRTIDSFKTQFFAGGTMVMQGMTGVIALLVFVTALGIFGLTSLSVAERTRQIGTRRALGATRRNILVHFITENWMVTTAGLVLGIAAAYGLNYLLVTHVSGVKMDWRYVAVGMVLLWTTGVVATIPPAMRGARVSPAVATRSV
jgi:putative ABC transport system permease protein